MSSIDVMIHDIDLVLDLVNAPVADVQALGTRIIGDHEDCVQAQLTFSNGTIADLTANRVSPVTIRKMQVWSVRGVQISISRASARWCNTAGAALRFGDGPLKHRRPGPATSNSSSRKSSGNTSKSTNLQFHLTNCSR